MRQQHVAHAAVTIRARPELVWDALTNPEMVRRWMEGTDVNARWTAGSPITWKGVFEGKAYEDHGKVLRAERCRVLEFTHFSPSMGMPDRPENYHTVRIELEGRDNETIVTLNQEGSPSEEARQRSADHWRQMLDGLKQAVEEKRARRGDRGMDLPEERN